MHWVIGPTLTLCYTVRLMKFLRAATTLVGLLLFAALPLAGCGALVGDSCEVDTDCGTGLLCDTTLPEGYCTLGDCSRLGCADKGICVHYDDYTSFCMAPCESSSDCREGYACLSEPGPHAFCGLTP